MTTTTNLNAILEDLPEIAIDLGRYQQDAHERPPRSAQSSDRASADGSRGAGLASVARRLLKEADARQQYFPWFVSSDPIWPILLDLYVHTAEDRLVSVSDACVAARVPNTTALRHIGELVEQGAVERIPDLRDRRRINLQLAAPAFASMSRYLASITGADGSLAASAVGTEGGQQRRSYHSCA